MPLLKIPNFVLPRLVRIEAEEVGPEKYIRCAAIFCFTWLLVFKIEASAEILSKVEGSIHLNQLNF